MLHAYLRGTHYEMGLQWGRSLAREGHFILENTPLAPSKERLAYAGACLPVYQKYFPAVLEEMRGLAGGQGCAFEQIAAVLLSMYALPTAHACSCFAVKTPRGALLGRNSDFYTAMEGRNLNAIYVPADGGYAFTGNTTAFIEMEDGVNARGLAVGLTSVPARAIAPGMNAGLLLRCILETCASVDEAIGFLKSVPIGSAQTLTLADAAGEIAVVECDARGLAAVRPDAGRSWVCATNMFCRLPSAPPPDGDDWFARRRYETLERALGTGAPTDAAGAQELLAGKRGFLCQYNRAEGRDTVWSAIYDLGRGGIFRAEGNPARVPFRRDLRFAL